MTKKAKLRSQALKLWYNKYLKDACEVCGSKFVLQGHHYFFRSSYGYLMFEKSNHITLCRKCHATLHWQDAKKIEEQIYLGGVKNGLIHSKKKLTNQLNPHISQFSIIRGLLRNYQRSPKNNNLKL